MQAGDLVLLIVENEVGIVTYTNGNMAQVQWAWGISYEIVYNLEVLNE